MRRKGVPLSDSSLSESKLNADVVVRGTTILNS